MLFFQEKAVFAVNRGHTTRLIWEEIFVNPTDKFMETDIDSENSQISTPKIGDKFWGKISLSAHHDIEMII